MLAHDNAEPNVRLEPVSAATWRAVAALRVAPGQEAYVAEPAYYLALCCYGDAGWAPLTVIADGEVVGFLMWAVDPDDGACWLGGVLIAAAHQGRGIGTAAVRAATRALRRDRGLHRFALSYAPANRRARAVYARLGFVETNEREGEEVVARLEL